MKKQAGSLFVKISAQCTVQIESRFCSILHLAVLPRGKGELYEGKRVEEGIVE